MASSKAKAESGPQKEGKGAGGVPAGEAAANSRNYRLDELDTVATVGEYRTGFGFIHARTRRVQCSGSNKAKGSGLQTHLEPNSFMFLRFWGISLRTGPISHEEFLFSFFKIKPVSSCFLCGHGM